MSFHKAERAITGSLKNFRKIVEESQVDIFEYEGQLFKTAIRRKNFSVLRYLFLGELHDQYKPSRPDALPALVTATRLMGRPVFDLACITDVIQESDHVDIFKFLQAFGYNFLESSVVERFLTHGRFSIITHLLHTGELTQDMLSRVDAEQVRFEMLVLLNTKLSIALPPKAYIASHEDRRTAMFRKKEGPEFYTVDNLNRAILDGNLLTVLEILRKVDIKGSQYEDLLDSCAYSNSGAQYISVLLDKGLYPSSLKEFIVKHSKYYSDLSAACIKQVLLANPENTKMLFSDEPSIVEDLLRSRSAYLHFLISNELIQPLATHMYPIMDACDNAQKGIEIFLELYQYGFPVVEMDLSDLSPVVREAITPIQEYLKKVMVPSLFGAG